MASASPEPIDDPLEDRPLAGFGLLLVLGIFGARGLIAATALGLLTFTAPPVFRLMFAYVGLALAPLAAWGTWLGLRWDEPTRGRQLLFGLIVWASAFLVCLGAWVQAGFTYYLVETGDFGFARQVAGEWLEQSVQPVFLVTFASMSLPLAVAELARWRVWPLGWRLGLGLVLFGTLLLLTWVHAIYSVAAQAFLVFLGLACVGLPVLDTRLPE